MNQPLQIVESEEDILKRLDKLEKSLDKGDDTVKKQIVRDTIRLAGKIPFARDSDKLNLNLAMSMLTQAMIFANDRDSADEAKKLLALARRVAR